MSTGQAILTQLKDQYTLLLARMDGLLEQSSRDAEGRRTIRNATQAAVANYSAVSQRLLTASPQAVEALNETVQKADKTINDALDSKAPVRDVIQIVNSAVNEVAIAIEELLHYTPLE